jgi:Kdo2-lipid IVA lauroyltransferase/acyltransferase
MKLKYIFEYCLLRGAVAFINILPHPLVTGLTYIFGWIIWIFYPFRLRVAYSNVSNVFPDMEHAEKIRLLRTAYLQFTRTFGLIFILHRKQVFRMIQDAEITGEEKLKEALLQKKGVILTTYHGFWFEAYFAWFNANNHPISLIYKKQKNPLSDAYFIRKRQRYGDNIEHLHTHAGMSSYQESLKKNRILIISLDQRAFNKGTIIPFFSQPLHCAKGTAILHLRTGAPVLTSVYYYKNGKLHIDIDRVELPDYQEINEESIKDISERSIAYYEAFIKENPEQWFSLFHKLWIKTGYPASVRRTLGQIFF